MRISDWSSDVCCTDLVDVVDADIGFVDPDILVVVVGKPEGRVKRDAGLNAGAVVIEKGAGADDVLHLRFSAARACRKIGIESCRDRVCQNVSIKVVAVALRKKTTHHNKITYTT